MRRPLGLRGQQQPLRHAEAVLLVDHGEAEVLVGHLLLEDGVGADQDVDRSVGQAHQDRFPRPALFATGEDADPNADAVELVEQGRMMLPREDLRWGEQRRLRAGLDRRQHGHQRNQGLAGPDITLQQPKHRCALRHVAADFLDHPALGSGHFVGEL